MIFGKKFTLEISKVLKNTKFRAVQKVKTSDFEILKSDKIDFRNNLSSQNLLKFPLLEFPIRLPRSVVFLDNKN